MSEIHDAIGLAADDPLRLHPPWLIRDRIYAARKRLTPDVGDRVARMLAIGEGIGRPHMIAGWHLP